ncbi:TlyA family RNA methyltransferase [Mycoplasmatota bacterium zrk1]
MKRLDNMLVELNKFSSRNKAQEAIKSGLVLVNGIKAKSSLKVDEHDSIEIIGNVNPFVSRAGLKLQRAIDEFELDFNDQIVLDVGASTGGFTDCSLKNGAILVYAIDVGRDQLVDKIKRHSKVISYEKTNILDVDNSYFVKGNPNFIVVDVSFVSLRKIIPYLCNFNTEMVVLIKPQFESNGKHLKNGVIKDKKIHIKILKDLINYFELLGLKVSGLTHSPITGKEGNHEFLVHFGKQSKRIDVLEVVRIAHRS